MTKIAGPDPHSNLDPDPLVKGMDLTDPDPVPDPHQNFMDPQHWPKGNTVR
jgi:hypothetical protein